MRSRRAISSVVGMVFAIIALTTTITYISYSMGVLNNYNQSVLTQNQQLTNVGMEKFQVASVTVPNSQLNVTVVNTGNLPINFTKIWIQNTSATDWVYSYVPTNNFVSPGGVLTNIGQTIPVHINPTKSYNVKLVTSRGNTQQFIMNSPNAAPLNIQLQAIPSTVDIGFNSTLVMVVTNNGSSTLVNVVPNTPTQTSGSAVCSLGQVTPASYSTLSPGSTAIFKWDVMVKSGANTQSCTFTAQPPLQNGYPTQSVSAKVTITVITFTQTLLAQNTGILTLNYSTFRWTQTSGTYSGTWYTGWTFPHAVNTALEINMTNNNATSDFYISAHSQIYYRSTSQSDANSFFIVNSTTPGSPFTVKDYTCGGVNDFCIKIPSGRAITIYFAANSEQVGTKPNEQQALSTSSTYFTNMLIFGKFATSQSSSGTQYSQSLPYIAIWGNP